MPCPTSKNKTVLAFLKVVLPTKTILNALHLQGPKSYIYIYNMLTSLE
jgi:hypothetical protein